MRHNSPRNAKKSGQSVIEFVFVILAFLNLLVVTINATMAFAVQQYMSYATFMAARAYQASNLTPQKQAEAARTVLESYIFNNAADLNAKVFRFHNDPNGKGTAREVTIEVPDPSGTPGAYGQTPPSPGFRIKVDFKVPLFQLPFGPSVKALDLVWVSFSAVSYLGREPTVSECRSFFENFYNYYTPNGKDGKDGWVGMDDNNC